MQTTVDDMATEMADGVSKTISGSVGELWSGGRSTCAAGLRVVFEGVDASLSGKPAAVNLWN